MLTGKVTWIGTLILGIILVCAGALAGVATVTSPKPVPHANGVGAYSTTVEMGAVLENDPAQAVPGGGGGQQGGPSPAPVVVNAVMAGQPATIKIQGAIVGVAVGTGNLRRSYETIPGKRSVAAGASDASGFHTPTTPPPLPTP